MVSVPASSSVHVRLLPSPFPPQVPESTIVTAREGTLKMLPKSISGQSMAVNPASGAAVKNMATTKIADNSFFISFSSLFL